MQLEFHQLDRRWEHLRVREPHRQRRLLASLADRGQLTARRRRLRARCVARTECSRPNCTSAV